MADPLGLDAVRLAALIWIADAIDGDADFEPDDDGEESAEGCCEANDDTGTRYARWPEQPIGAPRVGYSPGSDDDCEASPAPGFLHRCGLWRGLSVETCNG